MKMTGSQIIMEILLEQGVDTVFGYPGGAALNIYDTLYQYSDRIRHVLTAHEQGAAHAADGYARATGKTGVVFATSGPGATNLVTGIATAFMDSIPMVAITSNVANSPNIISTKIPATKANIKFCAQDEKDNKIITTKATIKKPDNILIISGAISPLATNAG